MLPRTLEPEVMDTEADALDYDSMDHSDVNRRFVEEFLAVWNGRNSILDVGTGTALIPIELCRQAVLAEVLGVDLSDAMLRRGRHNLREAGLRVELRARVEKADAKRLSYPDRYFGAVISNSIVHHIARPLGALKEMARVCVTGGTLFVRDLIRPPADEDVIRLVKTYAGTATPRQQQLFGDSLRAALTVAEVQDLVTHLGFDPAGVRRTSDRHWTWFTRLR